MKIRTQNPAMKRMFNRAIYDKSITFVNQEAEVPDAVGKKLLAAYSDLEEITQPTKQKREG